jgi:hypothetical protein
MELKEIGNELDSSGSREEQVAKFQNMVMEIRFA